MQRSGQWRLRWRALNTPKVFQGSIRVESGAFGVLRRIADGVANAVVSLDVNDSANIIEFEETTTSRRKRASPFLCGLENG